MTRNGERFGGRCIENCAFNPSILPLQSAIIHAISEGKLQSYEEVRAHIRSYGNERAF